MRRQRQWFLAGHIRFGSFLRELASLYDVIDGLRDIGRVVARSLDILGAKKHVTAKSDIVAIFHHIREEFPKQRSIQSVNRVILMPYIQR